LSKEKNQAFIFILMHPEENPNHPIMKALIKKGFTNISLTKPTNNNRYRGLYDCWNIYSDQYNGFGGYSIRECLDRINNDGLKLK
jgi:hypothetical protein